MTNFLESGIPWIGKIPTTWGLIRAKKCLCERNEKNFPISETFILSLTNDRGVIPYSEKGEKGNKAKEDLSTYKIVRKNDIVMNSMNVIIGSVGISNYDGVVSPVYYMLYPRNSDYSVYFINYLFQTRELQKFLRCFANGILEIRLRISMTKLNTVLLPMPKREVQDRIVSYLDSKIETIDRLIGIKNEQISKMTEYKKTLITEYVTKGVHKDAEFKDSGQDYLGKIPANWGIMPLRFLGELQNGISKSGDLFGSGYPFVSYGDVYKNYSLPEQVEGLVQSSEDERSLYSVKRGDVFFTRTSETIEEIGFSATCLKTIPDATFAGFLIRVRPKKALLMPEFTQYYFRSDVHRRFLVKEMNIVIRASLGQDLLKNLPVLIPPLSEQEQIVSILDKKCESIDKLISDQEAIVADLADYKKSLIYECVTGKKDI